MAISVANTLASVSHTKRIDAELRRRFCAQLKAWLDSEHAGNQSAGARALGVSQSHISAILNGARGVGLEFLVVFANETSRSLDSLLGLGGGAETDVFRRMLREELAAIRAEADQPKEANEERQPARRPASRPRRVLGRDS